MAGGVGGGEPPEVPPDPPEVPDGLPGVGLGGDGEDGPPGGVSAGLTGVAACAVATSARAATRAATAPVAITTRFVAPFMVVNASGGKMVQKPTDSHVARGVRDSGHGTSSKANSYPNQNRDYVLRRDALPESLASPLVNEFYAEPMARSPRPGENRSHSILGIDFPHLLQNEDADGFG